MIKYYCDRCGAEVAECSVKNGYRLPAKNATIELYTGGEDDPFVQGLNKKDFMNEYLFCDKCMAELKAWINEQPS